MDTGYPRRKSSVVQVENRDDGVLRVNDEHIRRMSVIDPNVASQNADAKAATDREHRMTVREAFRLYPKAIAFSLIFSTAIIMEGYDTALLGTFYGFLP
jgi:SP family general alpha glucoside:H+ symporter-like MFS transporter